MTLVVDPWHWLTPDGEIPSEHPQLRKKVLQVARVIEYGALLHRSEGRETLIECSKRSHRKSCIGLLWVVKTTDDSLHAFCPICQTEHMVVHNWQGTKWSSGPSLPVSKIP